jgi:hypothetical protein
MPAKKRVSDIVSVPAPIGGWNVRDPLPSMQPIYAPQLDNCFCLPSEIQVRKGYTVHATFTGSCQTLLEYNAANGSQSLYAAVNNAGACSIYDVTSAGAVGAAKVSGLTSAIFKQSHFATSGGNFSYFINGSDAPVLYDGTTWRSITTSSTPYAITGVTPSSFSDVVSHKRRLWFVQKSTLACWYLPTDQVAGAAVKFDFAPIFKKGGYITKIDTWSLDAGQGLDDYFVVFTSEGEVAVYSGTDPASASTWSLTGVFLIGSPTGSGHTVKYGGDLLIINKDGIAQMSKSLMSSRVNTWLQLTDKIQPQIAQDTTSYAANTGWDISLYFPQNMLIVNVPISSTQSYQYVMNTISGGWSRWTNIPAKCWYNSNDILYFGANGYVGRAWNGQNDNGADVIADILPAYQNFGSNSRLKRWSLGRILFGADGNASYGARMEMDFNLNPSAVDAPTVLDLPVAMYGTAKYDEAVYGGQILIRKQWKNLSGMGYWGSLHIKIKTNQADVRFYSYDMNIETGGNL